MAANPLEKIINEAVDGSDEQVQVLKTIRVANDWDESFFFYTNNGKLRYKGNAKDFMNFLTALNCLGKKTNIEIGIWR